MPAGEKRADAGLYAKLRALVEKNIDLPGILRISRKAPGLILEETSNAPRGCGKVTIAVARDKAFNFYYQDNLDILKNLGARLVEFSPLNDKSLPAGIDGLYIGGGYPELFSARLSANLRMREDVLRYAGCGLLIYAECGGLMYLVRNIVDFQGKSFPMCGIFNCAAVMSNKRQALGYIEIEVRKDNILSRKGDKIRAHTFHWSYLKDLSKDIRFTYKVTKGKDRVYEDGLIKENVLASYAHLHFASDINLARNFIKSCLTYKGKK